MAKATLVQEMCLKGIVSDINKAWILQYSKGRLWIQVEAAVTKQSIENLNIKEGKDINIFLKTTSIKVIKK